MMSQQFEKIVVVMLENSSRADTLTNSYMSGLRKKGVFLTAYNGVTHPSQPNYIASIAGDTVGINTDSDGYASIPFFRPTVSCLVDLMEQKDVSWRCYAEDLPENYVATQHQKLKEHRKEFDDSFYKFVSAPPGTFTEQEMKNDLPAIEKLFAEVSKSLHDTIPSLPPDSEFARRHVPFLSIQNVVLSESITDCVVNADAFETDLASSKGLRQVSWYVPNLINDGHSLTAEQSKQVNPAMKPRNLLNTRNVENFLRGFLSDDPIAKFGEDTLIFIVYDEAVPYTGPYGVYALLIGAGLDAGKNISEPYNHYSLLHSIQLMFKLGSLHRNDQTARPFWFLNHDS